MFDCIPRAEVKREGSIIILLLSSRANRMTPRLSFFVKLPEFFMLFDHTEPLDRKRESLHFNRF